MSSWQQFADDAPDLAAMVQARFESTGLGFLATIRKDGSPRISGIEPSVFRGELWLGMMDRSRKGDDLKRDPRLALHNASVDKELKEGDVKVTGRGIEVADPPTKQWFLESFREANGYGPPDDSPMDLFRVDITEVSTVEYTGDHLVIQRWAPGQGVRRVERK
jgi:hypothetical protein